MEICCYYRPVIASEPWPPAGVVSEGEEVADAVGEDALLEGLDVVQVSGRIYNN